jgi:Putative Actinobacterial Holin-X, holin superfamily III
VNSAPYRTEPTLAELVSDLANDAKQLLRQELALAKYEIREEIRQTKIAVISLGVGIGLAAIGGLLLIVMLVHVLNAFAGLPLWSCYAIVGGVCAIVGAIFIYRGKYQIAQIDMIPQQTVETMKENVRWIKESSTSEKI